MANNKQKGVIKRVLYVPDTHAPLQDKTAVKVLLKAIKIVKPDGFVHLGDVGEWESVSHWQWKRKQRPPLEYILPKVIDEVEEVNEFLDEIDEVLDKVNCKEKYITEGNHDDWLNRFVEEHPYLPQYTFQTAMNLKERGYKYYPAGKYLKIGKLYAYHGHHYAGIYHTANHLRRLGCNIIYGHHHSMQQDSVTHMDGAKSAWSIGCLKDVSDEANHFMGNRRNNWAHAFAIVDFYKQGHFTVHPIQIINGKASLWGELIEGD